MKNRTAGNPPEPSRDSLDAIASRERVRREILRTNTAVGVVLIIVLALTLGVALTGTRATRNQQRAELAEAAGLERLWESYLAQARAVRVTAVAGRREQALGVISNAAAIRPSPEIRSEAVATLALTDLEQDGPLIPLPGAGDLAELDPQLEHFAYGDGPGVVGVSRLRDGARLFRLEATNAGPGARMIVRSAAFSPDGRHVAARFDGGAVVVWNMASRERVFAAGLDATNQIIAGMTYSTDSKRLMFSDPDRDKQITVVDLENGERLVTGLRTGARPFRFRPGRESEVVVAQEGRLDLMEYPGGRILRSYEHPTRIFLSAWSPNGASLAVACEDGDVYLWDAERGTHRLLRGHSEPCIRLGFSPDGRLLFTGSRDGTTRLWAVESGQVIVTTKNSVAHTFSPDGKRIGFWQLSKAVGTWKVDTSDCFMALQCPKEDGAFVSLDLSGEGRWCVATQTKGVRVWDLAAENQETYLPLAGLFSTRMAPDGASFFICRASGLEQWFLADATAAGGALAFKSTNLIALPDQRGARNVAVSTDGTTAAVELQDHRLAVVDLRGAREPVVLAERWRGENLKSSATPTGPGRFAISPDGRWICTGYWLGAQDRPRVWDAHTGQMVAAPKAGSSLAMFSNDGKWLGLSGVGTFHIYSTAGWSHVKTIQRDESSFTHGAMAFMDQDQIALTRTRQSIQLRDAWTDEKFLDLIAPVAQSVTSIRVARNGSVLATGSARDMIQVWRLDRVRKHLAGMGMDWGGPAASPGGLAPARAAIWTNTRNMLIFGLAAFLGATMLSLFALRRHRAAIERFFEAEGRAVEHNRALEAARLELVHSQKMQALGTLAAGIAHDFNNLLSVIRMSNKLIGRATRNDPDLQENVTEIEQAVLQGKSVVGSMLGYARAENEPPGPVDLCGVIEDNVSLLSKEFLSGIALTLELDRNVPRVEIGRGQIDQVLLNLIVNASEAMQARGRLRITLHERSSIPDRNYVLRPAPAARYVELTVADSGPGIATGIRDRLFEPFFTTKSSGAKAGTGLGLSLVYSVARQEELGLSVESEPGQGAAFVLLCPVRETHSFQNKKPV
jgi:signal transduction histidine kinase